MSGGGRPSKGRMGQAVVSTNVATPGQVEKMAKQLDQLESRARQLRERQDTLQPLVNQLPQQLKKMHTDFKKFTAEIKSAMENEPLLKEQMRKQEENLKAAAPNPAEVKRMEAAIAKTQATYDKAAEAAEKVNTEVKKLHKQIVEKTGGKIQAAQKKLDDINKTIDKVRKEKTKLTVAITTSKRDVKKTTEKIANMEQEIKDAEIKLTNMQEEIKKITVGARELVDKIEEYSSQILEQEQVISNLKEQLRKIGEKEQVKKAAKLEIDHLLEGIVKMVQEFESRVRSLTKNLKALKINRIPGEDTVLELKGYSSEELEAETPENLQYKLSLAEAVLASKKPDFSAVDEYFDMEAVYMKKMKELEELTTQRNEMRAVVDDLRKRRLDEFMLGFNIITDKLKEMYQMITLGGDAELELVDSLDPFREGIIFSVRPPKKSWKNISNLSGGEKTLSSLALVFALHYYKPSPLYVMDEIDAALDFKNVSIVGNYIKERTKNAQFIIISLRANMFELADRLVGIYKTHNATKSCTINPRFYGKQAAKPTQHRDEQSQKTMDKTRQMVVQTIVESPMEQSDNNRTNEAKEKSCTVPSSIRIESVCQGEPLDVGILVEKPINNL